MANSRSDSTDVGSIHEVDNKPSRSFFRGRSPQAVQVDEPSESSEKTTNEPVKQEFPPVSFSELFRYVILPSVLQLANPMKGTLLATKYFSTSLGSSLHVPLVLPRYVDLHLHHRP